jgi:hypothetical protein
MALQPVGTVEYVCFVVEFIALFMHADLSGGMVVQFEQLQHGRRLLMLHHQPRDLGWQPSANKLSC